MVTERDLQSACVDLARLFGWRVAHFRPAMTKRGWRTPVEADGKGFPDLLLIRGTEIKVRELKVGRGKLSDEQKGWLVAFQVAGIDAGIWTEVDLPNSIADDLRKPA